jgi:acetyltransferase
MTIRNLTPLFHPRSVVVIGGSSRAGSLGERVLSNILNGGFGDTVFAVNPKRVVTDGVRWFDSIVALPEIPDLAIVVSPAGTVPRVIDELGALGTRVAVVITAGFENAEAKAAILEAARPHLLRIVGPNCLGVLMPYAALNASFAPRMAAAGRLAFVSQSGALVTSMLDWAADRHIGFSSVISMGDMADVDLGDIIDILAADARTDAILLYVEGVTNPAKFMSAARAASRIKPVIAIKAGRSTTGAKAAFSHTGALAGAYDVYAAAFERAGIVLVDSLSDLFDAAQILCRYRAHGGERLAIITNGGGAGVLAADALLKTEGTLATLSSATIAALDPQMPGGWSHANPVDVIGDAHAERFAAATRAMLADPGVDALLVIHCPTAVAAGTDIARAVIAAIEERGSDRSKPVIACWMGPQNASAVRFLFDAAGVPLFENLDDAVRAFGYLLQAAKVRQALLRAPSRGTIAEMDRSRAGAVVDTVRREGRTTLSALETRALLAAYGVPVAEGRLAATAAAVAAACEGLPGPYAVKLVSPQLPHKSDVGGVALDLAGAADAVAAAEGMESRIRREHPQASITGFEVETMVTGAGQELLLGIADDATFGPVLAFGAGGKAVAILNDRALGLPPLDDDLARDMIGATRVSRLLGGYRDVPACDEDAIVAALNALSAIAVDFPDIVELDINPLLATPHGVIAVDARARLSDTPRESHLVIRPVPMAWAADFVTRSGLKIHVRPVRPADGDALARLFHNVAPEDLRFRFLSAVREVGHAQIVAMTQVDYRRTMNFLAFIEDGTLIASAMLAADPDHVRAELAISVHAGFRNRGVSWTLVEHVMRYAAAEGIETVESIESRENHAALALEQEAGFMVVPTPGSSTEVTVRRQVGAR